MAEPIRWGVLGNATIARKCVLPAIVRSYNGRLHVLGTRRPDEAEKLACRHDIAKVVEGYEAVLKDPDVHAVYIPLPNHLHLPWALKAMEAGKHVLCEKPLACSARQAVEMADAARQSDQVLMEALMYRFHPRSRQILSCHGMAWHGMHFICFSIVIVMFLESSKPELEPGYL